MHNGLNAMLNEDVPEGPADVAHYWDHAVAVFEADAGRLQIDSDNALYARVGQQALSRDSAQETCGAGYQDAPGDRAIGPGWFATG